MVVFFGVACITAACAAEIVTFVYSVRYVEASQCLVILAPAMYFASHVQVSMRLIEAADRPGQCLAVVAALLIVSAVFYVLLIPRLAMMGAALASLITFGVGAVAATVLVYRHFRVWPSPLTAARCGVAGAVVYVLCCAWPVPGGLVAAKLAGASLLYLLMLVAARELRQKDLRALRLRARP